MAGSAGQEWHAYGRKARINMNTKINMNNRKKDNKWKRLLGYYKPHKAVFAADMFFAVLGAVVSLLLPLIVRYITGNLASWSGKEAIHKILALCAVMVGLVLVETFSNFFIAYYGHMMGAKMEARMRQEIFDHYQKLSFAFYDNQKVGQLLSRVTSDLFDISELLHHGPEDLFISLIKFVGAFGILIAINWKLALLAFLLVPVMFLYAFGFFWKMKHAFKKNREEIGNINGTIEDNLSGIRVVKSFANEEIEKEKFHKSNGRFVEAKRKSYLYMGGYHSGLSAFISLITIVVITGGGILSAKGIMEVADVLAFLLYVNNFSEPVKKLINFTEQFQNGFTGFERFLEIINTEPDIKDKEDAVELRDVKGQISYENVSFRYEENSEKVLSHLNLSVRAGEYVAIVGSSGGGKTTLCSLLPRFYEVSSGSIKIDGIDIRDVTLHSLRNQIGIVQQDVYLFAGSVMDNIRYGRPDASEEEVIAAAKQANAHEFIMELSDGYRTDIGQRGIKLSGGQKQRLSIARVFLKNPPILIFDEATSALDNESERIVQESMEALAKNRTTLVIAHRLSTIQKAERILVLTEKGIEEEGTHEELLKKQGIYARLYGAR